MNSFPLSCVLGTVRIFGAILRDGGYMIRNNVLFTSFPVVFMGMASNAL